MPAIAAPPSLIQLKPSLAGSGPRVESLAQALHDQSDSELSVLFEKSWGVFDEIASRHLPRWVVTFSGGKDSTLAAILASDYVAQMNQPPSLDIIYSDTLMEIPPMRQAAGSFLDYLSSFAADRKLPIETRIVRPRVEDRFWVRMIGRGYPPPKPKFRWCTKRLKISPAAPFVNTGVPTAVLTGVRYGESAGRTGRLVASCTNGGECGQDYWAERGPRGSNITYFAPVIDWKTCKVWDFLHFVAPQAGWPTQDVFALYGDTSLRFGCWTCTLVRRDRTLEVLVGRGGDDTLPKLNAFRNEVLYESKLWMNRWPRKHRGVMRKGPLCLRYRIELLERVRGLEADTGLELLSHEEEAEIRALWSRLPLRARGALSDVE